MLSFLPLATLRLGCDIGFGKSDFRLLFIATLSAMQQPLDLSKPRSDCKPLAGVAGLNATARCQLLVSDDAPLDLSAPRRQLNTSVDRSVPTSVSVASYDWPAASVLLRAAPASPQLMWRPSPEMYPLGGWLTGKMRGCISETGRRHQ